jgi:hypothetical protein
MGDLHANGEPEPLWLNGFFNGGAGHLATIKKLVTVAEKHREEADLASPAERKDLLFKADMAKGWLTSVFAAHTLASRAPSPRGTLSIPNTGHEPVLALCSASWPPAPTRT